MPIIKRAAKKLRHDRNRTKVVALAKKSVHDVLKDARKHPTKKTVSDVFQALDKAAKRNIIHPNKAARLKSRLSKLLAKK